MTSKPAVDYAALELRILAGMSPSEVKRALYFYAYGGDPADYHPSKDTDNGARKLWDFGFNLGHSPTGRRPALARSR